MTGDYLIQKSSGESQHYSADKLRNSLRLAGATNDMINSIIHEVEKELSSGITSRRIFKKAFRLLRSKQHSMAARYSLKNAIMELGPTGFPFEKYIGEIFKEQGYQVKVGVLIDGKCVTHEIDVVASNNESTIMVECKYHNTPGKMCNVQVPLYIHSRFQDIRDTLQTIPVNGFKTFEGWVITNTRFTTDAEQYGRCAGLHLVGWDYPRRGSLKDLVENAGLFPITAITSLNMKQKQQLIDMNIVLCRDLLNHRTLLDSLGLNSKISEMVMTEVNELCF